MIPYFATLPCDYLGQEANSNFVLLIFLDEWQRMRA